MLHCDSIPCNVSVRRNQSLAEMANDLVVTIGYFYTIDYFSLYPTQTYQRKRIPRYAPAKKKQSILTK